jgi:hypothetical protein
VQGFESHWGRTLLTCPPSESVAARDKIDALMVQAGWLVQDRDDMNLTAGDAIEVREFKLKTEPPAKPR